jgi:hypothetical protein
MPLNFYIGLTWEPPIHRSRADIQELLPIIFIRLEKAADGDRNPHRLSTVLDPGNKVDEIYEGNNTVVIPVHP